MARWRRMRSQSEHSHPREDAFPDIVCQACGGALTPAGLMDSWFFLSCETCTLVWRVTPTEWATAARGRPTLREAC